MKKIIFIIALSIGVSELHAQLLEQGKQQLYYERYNSAEKSFHQLIQQNPNDAVAWYWLVRSYIVEDKLSKAADSLQYVPLSIQSEPFYQVAKGAVLLNGGNVEEAAGYFSSALKDTREKDEAVLGAIAQAHIHAEKGDANYAIELLNKAIRRDKRNPEWNVLMGDAYLKLHNGSEAYKSFQEAISKSNKYAVAYHRIGEIFLSQKNAELYVENFQKSIAADPSYAPSFYKLYAYEFNRNPKKAMEYYQAFERNSDRSIQNDYDLADLFYINKNFDSAINKAKSIIMRLGEKAQPRLYKLIGYSFAKKTDTSQAISFMKQYFLHQPDSTVISKDYESMGEFYAAMPESDSLAMVYLDKAVQIEKDSAELPGLYRQLAQLAANQKDFAAQSKWLGKYYAVSAEVNNVDLFNWGLSSYRAGDYQQADSVFGLYAAKYPEQSFGYYWQAKAKALQDPEMKEGFAIPAYEKVIEVLKKNLQDPNYKNWMVDAYSYLAAYEVNTKKDYAEAVNYFEKVLTVDPENSDAKKYIDVLEKSLADKGTK